MKESKLKADLHVEFLNIYLSEYIFPKGLTIPLKPKVRRQKEAFLKKWSDLMDVTSKNATALFEEYWKNEQKELKTEVEKADNEMKNLLGDEEKDTHDKDMQEILKSKEEELRKSNKKSCREIENYIKSEQDTQIQLLSQLTRRSPQNTLGKSWRGQNLNQEFPLKKTFQTRTKKVTTKDLSEEEANKEKSPIFVEEDQRSANLKAEEIPRLKASDRTGKRTKDKTEQRTKQRIRKIKISQLRKKRVVNKSSVTLTKHMEDLLSKNLNFCPKPSRVDEAELDHSLKKFGSKLIWKEFHSPRVIDSEDEEQPYTMTLLQKLYKAAPKIANNSREPAINAYMDAVKDEVKNWSKKKPTRDNLTKSESEALNNLKNRTDIVIKPADKGRGFTSIE